MKKLILVDENITFNISGDITYGYKHGFMGDIIFENPAITSEIRASKNDNPQFPLFRKIENFSTHRRYKAVLEDRVMGIFDCTFKTVSFSKDEYLFKLDFNSKEDDFQKARSLSVGDCVDDGWLKALCDKGEEITNNHLQWLDDDTEIISSWSPKKISQKNDATHYVLFPVVQYLHAAGKWVNQFYDNEEEGNSISAEKDGKRIRVPISENIFPDEVGDKSRLKLEDYNRSIFIHGSAQEFISSPCVNIREVLIEWAKKSKLTWKTDVLDDLLFGKNDGLIAIAGRKRQICKIYMTPPEKLTGKFIGQYPQGCQLITKTKLSSLYKSVKVVDVIKEFLIYRWSFLKVDKSGNINMIAISEMERVSIQAPQNFTVVNKKFGNNNLKRTTHIAKYKNSDESSIDYGVQYFSPFADEGEVDKYDIGSSLCFGNVSNRHDIYITKLATKNHSEYLQDTKNIYSFFITWQNYAHNRIIY